MRTARVGGLVVVVGFFLLVAATLADSTGGCTKVEYEGEPPGGFRFLGVDFGRFVYTPDGGVNECYVSFGYVLGFAGLGAVPLGLLAIVVGYVRERR